MDWAEFGVLPQIGRLPRVYYLTERGARYLAEAWRVEPEEINYPRGVNSFLATIFTVARRSIFISNCAALPPSMA